MSKVDPSRRLANVLNDIFLYGLNKLSEFEQGSSTGLSREQETTEEETELETETDTEIEEVTKKGKGKAKSKAQRRRK